ncbi:uncharacterized protein LOC108915675 [Anoplophora glabripennis]|uniref:uncharacterized protein LOC108915675 n=1 Tax=Anoplophora glabripennis TaxID=217634 RepID=UPI000874CE42|nr:uncharacterized protein LOC108915675 [Anoplophora glabripennis]
MKVVLFILFVCALYSSVYSWTAVIEHKKGQSDHGGHCYTDSPVFKIGSLQKYEKKRIESSCLIAECLENKDISLWGCAKHAVEPPCYVVPGNLLKPYPRCCPKIKCPENMKEEENRLNLL